QENAAWIGQGRERSQHQLSGRSTIGQKFGQVGFGEVLFALCSRKSINGAKVMVDDSATRLNAWLSLSFCIGESLVVCLAPAAATPSAGWRKKMRWPGAITLLRLRHPLIAGSTGETQVALPAAATVCQFARHGGWGRMRLKCFDMAPVQPWLSPFFVSIACRIPLESGRDVWAEKKEVRHTNHESIIHATCDHNSPAHPARPESCVMD
ncbi:hypothetical protein BDP55DRAFT_737161, partial [Colletotrichum godetiae]